MKRNVIEILPSMFLVLLGFCIGIAISLIYMNKAFAIEEPDEDVLLLEESVEPISVKAQAQKDIDAMFLEWVEEQEDNEPHYLIEVTQEDIDLMARVVMSEGSILSNDAKQAIAQTIVNRVRTDFSDFKDQNSVSDVVNYPNAYSTQDNGDPTVECYQAVEAALIYEAFPIDMYWFREDHFHEFGTDYCRIGNTYFSRGISNGN